MPPSTATVKLSDGEVVLDQFARRLITAQDLSMITRLAGESDAELRTVVVRWLREQGKFAK